MLYKVKRITKLSYSFNLHKTVYMCPMYEYYGGALWNTLYVGYGRVLLCFLLDKPLSNEYSARRMRVLK